MLRFPNPGSDIDTIIRIYQELFAALHNRSTFDLDDISRTLVERNLATSSGYMGEQALIRSARDDRSRDSIYNQSKSYSEIYKILGWLHPTAQSALRFKFTYFGAHVVAARRDPAAIFRESILGVVYPNAILNVRGNYILRPFATILRTIEALSGIICRDEMIVGPLCLEDDRDEEKFSTMIEEIQSFRGDWSKLNDKMDSVSRTRGISRNTMGNYTRFPIAVLRWAGWTKDKRRRDIYGKSLKFDILTDEGYEVAQTIKASRDIRAADLGNIDSDIKDAISRVGFYQLLERAGFEVDIIQNQLSMDQEKASPFFGSEQAQILFSPFQELQPEDILSIFPDVSGTRSESDSTTNDVASQSREETSDYDVFSVLPHLSSRVSLLSTGTSHKTTTDDDLITLFKDAEAKAITINDTVSLIAHQYKSANQSVFYPLIAKLFSALGYNCEVSRPGVNYQRFDAIIIDPENTIPIEIKSPGEEEFLSVKAVRQALENKIILLARQSFPTKRHTTSLVVGYNLPNDRSEVVSLISDIYKAYDIVIGVVDFRSLLRLVAATVLQGKEHDSTQLVNLYGIIDISDT